MTVTRLGTSTLDGLTDVVVTTAARGNILAHDGTHFRNRSQGVYDVRDFGAVGNGAADDTAAIQAAITAATATKGTVFFPVGIYLTGPLTVPAFVNLLGPSPQNQIEVASSQNGATLKLKSASTGPLLTLAGAGGTVRGTSVVGGGSQYYQNTSLTNLGFDGNRTNQTTMDADIIRLVHVWNTSITGCYGIDAKGFGIRALDCNMLLVQNSAFVQAPFYGESLADSRFVDALFGGGNGTVNPCFWLAGTQQEAWHNSFIGGRIFNNVPQASIPTATVDAGTDIITTSATHGWVDNTPVIVTTTGTIPGGIIAGRTHYAKVLSTTTLKLATTPANLAAGTYVNITDVGAGTHTVKTGEDCNLYLSDLTYCKWNTFSGVVIDQAHGHNVVIDGGMDNTLANCRIVGAGLGNVTGQYGVSLRNGAIRTNLDANDIDGLIFASGASNTNQVIGIYADAVSYGTKGVASNNVRAHSTANVQIVNYTGEAEHLSFGTHDFEVTAGTPVIGGAGAARRSVWLLDAAAAETVGTEFFAPVGWRTIKIAVWWINAGAGAGDVVWTMTLGQFAETESFNVVDQSGNINVTGTAGTQDVLVKSTFANLSVAEGKMLFLRVGRLAADAADTLANDAGLVAVRLERVM